MLTRKDKIDLTLLVVAVIWTLGIMGLFVYNMTQIVVKLL